MITYGRRGKALRHEPADLSEALDEEDRQRLR
jgi:hypothetical protein